MPDGGIGSSGSPSTLRPNIEMAAEHIRLLTGSPDTPAWFRVFDDSGKDGNKAAKFFGTVAERWQQIEWQADGCGIFIVVNGGGNKRTRSPACEPYSSMKTAPSARQRPGMRRPIS